MNRQSLLRQKKDILINNRLQYFEKVRQNIPMRKAKYLQVETYQNNMINQIEIKLPSFFEMDYTFQMLPELINMFKEGNIVEKHKGIIGIRNLKTMNLISIQTIAESEIIPTLMTQAKQSEYPLIKKQALTLLSQITAGSTHQCEILLSYGIIKLFIQQLYADSNLEYVLMGLGNLAGDSSLIRNNLIDEGGVKHLLSLIKITQNTQIQDQCYWVLSNICRGSPLPPFQAVRQAIQQFCRQTADNRLSKSTSFQGCIWSIFYHTQSKQKAKILLQFNVLPAVMKFLKNETNISQLMPSLRVCGNASLLVDGSQQFIKHNGFQRIDELVWNDNKHVRRQVCWLLSNLLIDSRQIVYAFVDGKKLLIRKLLQLLENDDQEIKKEVCYIFVNLTGQVYPQIYSLFKESNLIRLYIACFKIQNYELVRIALECLNKTLNYGYSFIQNDKNVLVNILQRENGIQEIEKLQYHPNHSIYQQSLKILQKYFEVDEIIEDVKTLNKNEIFQ